MPTQTEPTKLGASRQADQTAQTFSMSLKAQELADECVTRKSLLIALSDNKCFGDAIMLLSYAMAHKKGLQWALKSIRSISDNTNDENTLDAAEKWLEEPNEENRAQILPSSVVTQPTSATWLAMATYWSGGCISDTPIIESAPDGLVNDSIYSSVMLSVQETAEENQFNAYSEVINQGIKLLYA